MDDPVPRRPLVERLSASPAGQIEPERIHVRDSFPCGRRLGDLDGNFLDTRNTSGPERVESANATRWDDKGGPRPAGSPLGGTPQSVIGQRAGRKHHHADTGLEQGYKVLAHRLVRSRLDDRFGS